MNSAQLIKRWMQQTQSYWYADGFQDIGFGAFILILGLIFLGEMLTPPGSTIRFVWSMAMPLFLVGGGLLVNLIVRKLKERVTWPRTGYVGYESTCAESRWLRSAIVAVVAAVVAATMVLIQKHWFSWSVVLGFVYLGALGVVAYRFGLWRYLVVGLWALVLGLGLAPLSLTMEQSGAIFHMGVGTAMLVAGWLTWRRYNASAPPPQELTDGSDS